MAAYYAERARGGVGLIVTGGIAPNFAGRVEPRASQLSFPWQVGKHRLITTAVHAAGGKIAMQILHAGRYAYHPLSVAPSALRSPISPFKPRGLTRWGVEQDDRRLRPLRARSRSAPATTASRSWARRVISSTSSSRRRPTTATTTGAATFDNRIRFPVEIVRRTRDAVGSDFIIIFRLSMLDLVEGGSTWDEVVALGKAVETAGATLINTGIGWHEARIPTIATMVPRAAFTWVTKRMKRELRIPLITTNRINDPAVAEAVLAQGDADMVSMARPFLADAEFVNKAAAEPRRRDQHLHRLQPGVPRPHFRAADRLVPRQSARLPRDGDRRHAGGGTESASRSSAPDRRDSSCATTAAEAGHTVTLFEAAGEIGGQFNLARRIPGKDEFAETLRYFRRRIERTGVDLQAQSAGRGAKISPVSTRSCWRRASCRARPAFPASIIRRSRVTSTSFSAGGRPAGASRSSVPAASASTSANS